MSRRSSLLYHYLFLFLPADEDGGGRAMSFGRAAPNCFSATIKPYHVADVAGVDEAKEELQEVSSF